MLIEINSPLSNNDFYDIDNEKYLDYREEINYNSYKNNSDETVI